MTRAPFAHKGEHVTCPNGHVVETFARDVYHHEILTADWFIDSKLEHGDEWGQCRICGEFCCFGEPMKDSIGPLVVILKCMKMHIEGRWRHII
jgi:hypothetical protein